MNTHILNRNFLACAKRENLTVCTVVNIEKNSNFRNDLDLDLKRTLLSIAQSMPNFNFLPRPRVR